MEMNPAQLRWWFWHLKTQQGLRQMAQAGTLDAAMKDAAKPGVSALSAVHAANRGTPAVAAKTPKALGEITPLYHGAEDRIEEFRKFGPGRDRLGTVPNMVQRAGFDTVYFPGDSVYIHKPDAMTLLKPRSQMARSTVERINPDGSLTPSERIPYVRAKTARWMAKRKRKG